MWDETRKNIGAVRPYSETNFTFTYTGDKGVKKVTPSCASCTKVKYNNGTLNVTYTHGVFPYHLAHSHSQLPINKDIIIEYMDGSKDKLSFYGILTK